MNRLNVGFSYILILGMLGFLTGCGLTQFKTVMTYDDATNTATMISNVPATGEVKGAKISQERGENILKQIGNVVPNVEVAK